MLVLSYLLIILLPLGTTIPVGVNQLTHDIKKRSIDEWCTLSDDKSYLDCAKVNFIGKTAGIRIKVNKCDNPVTINVNVIVKALGIDWSHVLESDQEFPIPGFEYSVGGVAKAGVYVKNNIYKDGDDKNLKLKLMLKVKITVGNVPVKLPALTVFDDVIPIQTKCGKYKYFSWANMSVGERVGIIAAGCIGFILMIVIIIALYVRCRTTRTRFRDKPLPKLWSISTSNIGINNSISNNLRNNNNRNNNKQNGGRVMKNIRGYENKQYVSDQTNIKVAGKAGPQKFKLTNLYK